MLRVFLVLLSIGVLLTPETVDAATVDIIDSSPTITTIRATVDIAPETEIPLGLVAVSEDISLRSTVSGSVPAEAAYTVSMGEPVMVREMRLIPVYLSCNDTEVRGEATVDVVLHQEGGYSGYAPFRGYMPDNFASILQGTVLNWDQVEIEERSPGLRYLMIVADDLEGAAYTLFDWKQKKGLGPQMTKLSDIPGGTSEGDIRDYIQSVYQTTGTLEYVLLIGDFGENPTGIPSHSYYNQVDGGYMLSDKYFAYISGGDDLPDVFLGRLPANSAADLTAMTNKILEYERGVSDGEWMSSAVMAAGTQHPSQKQTKRIIRNQLFGFGFTEVDTIFAPDQTGVDLITSLNEGRSILNYRGGVADREQWNAINFTQDFCYFLGNGSKRPLVVSVICLTGDFSYTGGSYGECLGESWLRAPNAAVAFFGATHITHTFANNTLDLGVYDGLVNQGLRNMGPITDAGLFYLFNNYAPGDTVQIQIRQYVLLGDPELALWTHEPYSMNITHPASVPMGTSNVTVNTGTPGALVCLRGSGVYEAVYADGSGNAYFSITPTSVGAIDVTVSSPGFFPYEGQMNVAATYAIGGTITDEDGNPLQNATVQLSGDASDQVTTNSDGWFEFSGLNQGETFTVTPSYSNAAGSWTFVPESRTVENLQGDSWGQDFTGYWPRYSLGGTIRGAGGNPIEGVTVTLSESTSDQTITNQDGWFEFLDLRGGRQYALTPSYTPQEGSWTFDPESRTILYLDQDRWNQDFTGAPPQYGISGTVLAETGEPLMSVMIVLSEGGTDTAYTDEQGRYTMNQLSGGTSYTVTPSYDAPEGQWTFDPAYHQFDPLLGQITDADFEGIRPRYDVSGGIVDRDGTGLEGVLLRVTGGVSDSVETDQDGEYSFIDLPGGYSYTFTPALAYDDSVDWGFDPSMVYIEMLAESLEEQDFIAQLPVVLTIGDGFGEPGTSGNPVDVALDNETFSDATLDTVSFTVLYTSSFGYHIPESDAVLAVGRAEGMTVMYDVDETNEAACSLFVSIMGADPVESGTGSIVQILFDVDAAADTSRATQLSFVTAGAHDPDGYTVPVDYEDVGTFGSGVGAYLHPSELRLSLDPPQPNPSTGDVQFSFQVPRAARTVLVVRDLNGRVVTELEQGVLSPGNHRILWKGTDESGNPVANGAYHCQLVAGAEAAHRLVVLLR